MKLMVNHQTHYRYTQIARNSVQSIKMMPQSSRHQTIEDDASEFEASDD